MRLSEATESRRHTNNFDLMRLFGAGCVLFAHSFNVLGKGDPFPIARFGWGFVGVLIFFSISGFLVSRSWDSAPRIGAYLSKRALRLMPALVVNSLLCAFVLGPLVTDLPWHQYLEDPLTKRYLIDNSVLNTNYLLPGVFVHNPFPIEVNAPLGTLPIEAKCYVFVIIAGLCGLFRRVRWLMPVIATLAVLICIDAVRKALPGADRFVASLWVIFPTPAEMHDAHVGQVDFYAYYFAAFAVAAALYSLREWIPLRWDLGALATAGWLGTVAIGGTGPLVGSVVFAPYVVLLVGFRTGERVHLPRRWGDYSYGLYLYAFPVQQVLVGELHLGSGWVVALVALPITMVLAVLSWHVVEHRALRLKPRPSARASVADSVAAGPAEPGTVALKP